MGNKKIITHEQICEIIEKLGYNRISPNNDVSIYEQGDIRIMLYREDDLGEDETEVYVDICGFKKTFTYTQFEAKFNNTKMRQDKINSIVENINKFK